ncbi:uncharacterized protein LOC127720485 [Mytilus californianus]|uniref:uncharacterized protein LOC127720485 n=1 Tax=Mytilus californianus TaxID=6549 RepID=UPI00224668A5|nr:uncharacterized protein LOC127720485 [Mytilus californianus]
MATVYEIEVDSEAYTCLWLTQNAVNKQHAEQREKLTKFHELDFINRNPSINVFTESPCDNFNFLTGSHDHWKKVSSETNIRLKISRDITRPKALVFLLSPSRHRGIYHLSKTDLNLLDKLHDIPKCQENFIFLVKASASSVPYNTEDLENLSSEIHARIIQKGGKNEIFKKIFHVNDNQIPVRIGVCLLDSLIWIMKEFNENAKRFSESMNNNLTELVEKRESNIKWLAKKMSKSGFTVCNFASQKLNYVKTKDLSKLLRKEMERRNLLVGIKLSKENRTCQLDQTFQTKLNIFLRTKKLFLKGNQLNSYKRLQSTASSTRFTRSMAKEDSTSKDSSTNGTLKRKRGITHRCSAMCNNIFDGNDYQEMTEDIYAELLNFVTCLVNRFTEDLKPFSKTISEERLKRLHSLKIHEWKTVTMRNVLVKGFGCIENNICVYTKRDDEHEKKSVCEYVKKYLNDPPGKYQLRVEYKQRKISLFSKLEQGSKINRRESGNCSDEGRKFGSLGMFLEDKNGKYFFTTCAHVIGEEEHAYSPDDNSKLGRNVYINYSDCNKDDKNDPYIDFSLVQVSPERTLTCTFGLKTTGGDFINGRIFRGDLSEILNENVYKWGATEPCLRKGKCIGFEDEGSLLYLTVDTKDFAKGGDSGAIVCVGEDVETGLAAFVIVAGSTDDSGSESLNSGSSYLVYKVSDALDRIGTISGMTPCLNPYIRTISISSPISDSKRAASKRKTPDKI